LLFRPAWSHFRGAQQCARLVLVSTIRSSAPSGDDAGSGLQYSVPSFTTAVRIAIARSMVAVESEVPNGTGVDAALGWFQFVR